MKDETTILIFENFLDDNLEDKDYHLKETFIKYYSLMKEQERIGTQDHYFDCKCWQCR